MKILNLNFYLEKFITPIILAITTIAIYFQTLWYGFIFDDLPTITKNILIIKGSNTISSEFFANSRWISRYLNKILFKYWQTNPLSYRVINLTLHVLTGIIIYYLLLGLLSNFRKSDFIKKNAFILSTLTSGLFLLHPTQTQTATYITQMQLEGTANFFLFLTILTFVYAVKSSNIFFKIFLYASSLTATVFAAGTKEIIIVLPFLVLLIDWFFLAQGDKKTFIKRLVFHFLIFTTLYGTLAKINFNVLQTIPTKEIAIDNNRGNILTQTHEDKIRTTQFFISQFKVISHYIKIFFWPPSICFDYETKLSNSFFDSDSYIPFFFLFLILLTAIFLLLKNSINLISFCIFWFFIAVIPRASIIPSSELICDYKTYIASFGILFLISLIIVYTANYLLTTLKIHEKTFFSNKLNYLSGTILLLIFICGYATTIRNHVWSSELLFWEDVIKKAPNKSRGYNNYAVSLAELGQTELAIQNYKKSAELDTHYAEPLINLAIHYQTEGQNAIALEYYKKAIEINEPHPEMYLNLGILHFEHGSQETAKECFEISIQLRQCYSKAHAMLAQTHQNLKNFEKAIFHYKQAIDGDCPNIEYYYQHAVLCLDLNLNDQALESLEQIKKINMKHKDSIFLLASCYYNKRDYKQALLYFEQLYQQKPNANIIAYNYAQSLMNTGKFNQALPLFEQCQNDTNTFPFAKLHIAKCHAQIGEKNKAIKVLNSLIALPPNQTVKNDSILLLKELNG